MSVNTKRNLSIIGDGSAGGGQFDAVKITGDGGISGDLECRSLRCVGNGKFHGNVKAVSLTGHSIFHGNLSSSEKVKLNDIRRFTGS